MNRIFKIILRITPAIIGISITIIISSIFGFNALKDWQYWAFAWPWSLIGGGISGFLLARNYYDNN